ncbi:MAG TPA: HAD-IA family hydrolase [Gemmatimonadaceae bacterium]
MPARPRAVLFDLDGTLIDSIALILQSAQFAFVGHDGPVPTDAEWLAGVGTPLVAMFRKYARDDAQVDALIARYREYQIPNHDRLVTAYDGVVDTVRALRAARHPMGIVTSKTESLARRGLGCIGIGDCFDVLIGCDTTERHKPDPAPVLAALDRLGIDPADAVFVGDSVHDMAAGNAAGVVTIAALWGPFTREDLAPSHPAHWLERIADLPELLGTRK